MKTKLAIALSVAGVLSAGSAAALVNTQILDGEGASGDAALAAPSSDASATPSPAPSSTTATTLTSRLTTFQVGEAGAVSVDLVDGRIVVPSAQPAAGWTVASIDDASDDGQIDVSFSNESAVVDLAVTLVGDQFVPQVRSTAVTTTTAVTSTTPATTLPSTTAPSTITPSTSVAADTVANTLVDDTVADAGIPTTSIDDHGGGDDDDDDHDDDDHDDDHGGGDDDDDSGRGRGRGRGGDDD